MTMETKITPEQQALLNKAGRKFFISSIVTGISSGLMLCLINFILVMAQQIFDFSPTLGMILACASGFFIIRRISSISKENYDRFVQEAKKIIEPK